MVGELGFAKVKIGVTDTFATTGEEIEIVTYYLRDSMWVSSLACGSHYIFRSEVDLAVGILARPVSESMFKSNSAAVAVIADSNTVIADGEEIYIAGFGCNYIYNYFNTLN